jgi:hypothetical protein
MIWVLITLLDGDGRLVLYFVCLALMMTRMATRSTTELDVDEIC